MKRLSYTKGEKIGSLTFIREVETIKGYRRGEFECPFCNEFFNTRIADAKHLKATKCSKCRYEVLKTDKIAKKIKNVLKSMKQRCYNTNATSFKHYGGQGVIMCKEWKENSDTFVKWALSNGYKEGLTIERRNVHGNYEPLNCTWIPRAKQAENKRDNRKHKYIGVSPHSGGFVARVTVKGKGVYVGWSKSEKEVALARDNYILKHKLKRKLNF